MFYWVAIREKLHFQKSDINIIINTYNICLIGISKLILILESNNNNNCIY
jgi:hypothetical protein